jgi:uncharacterized protein with HEPN domain
MISFAHRVLSYTAGLDQHSFTANGVIYDATLRNLELIGEADTHIPDQVRSAHSEIPWRLIIATRNRLIHSSWGLTTIQSGASFKTIYPHYCHCSRP